MFKQNVLLPVWFSEARVRAYDCIEKYVQRLFISF